jgi:hypothetical protein
VNAQNASPSTASTPAAQWRVDGEPDPHAGHYDGERAALTLGKLTDDELANGVYMNADQPMDMARMLAKDPDYHPPIVWLTAAKERIRWLSRALVRAQEAATTPEAQAHAPRGTSAQIQLERNLTCEAIDGAIAFGYRGDPAPEPGHWLEPYWKLGHERAEHERTHLSESDLRKLRHMLGADTDKRSQWGYRNYYATSGGPAMDALERMQTLGLVQIYSIRDEMKYYRATEAGCKAAGLNAKQIKRALNDD